MSQRYWCEFAWIDGQVRADVWLTVDGGRFTEVTLDAAPDGIRLYGLTLPGLANAHSHAFHRALRGRVEPGHESGSFWTWRDAMYGVADSLDPDTYFALARAVYAEMALAGVTCVGEFHYLHHGPGGTPYDDPNAMGAALMSAGAEAGMRVTLLDTCYLTSTVDGQPLRGPQRRFGDGSAAGWAERVSAVRPAGPGALIGAAVHSVRAVPDAELPVVMEWAAGKPVHVHVSEQPAENKASLVHYGRTPTAVLADAGVLGPTTTAVHATHLTDADRAALGDSGTAVCLCPTTERDLADGLGPAAALAYAGGAIAPEIQRAADQCIEDNRVHTDLEPALPDDLRLANLVSRNGNVAVVFTTEGGALYCFNEPGNGSRSMTRRVVSNWMPGAIEIGGATSMEAHGTSDYFATAGRVSSRVARVVLDHGNGRQTAANVADGTFVVIADGDVEVDETVLVAYDSAGTEIARSQGWSRRGLSEQSADCYVDPTGAVVWGSTPGTVCRDAEAWR
ncbi:hypothetical protein GCM10009558_066700 [Virgisporangium aurantiacum]